MNNYYVYVYLDPRRPQYSTGSLAFQHKPFYVGKGKEKRAYKHTNESYLKRTKNYLKKQKILDILNEGLEPVIEFYKTNLTEQEAMQYERELIAELGTKWNIQGIKRGVLCNMTSGGDGYTPCEELKKRASKRFQGERNPMYGKTHDERALAKIREQSKKLKHNQDALNKMSSARSFGGKAFMGKKWIVINPQGEEVEVLDLKTFCRENNLPYNTLYNSYRRGTPIGKYRNKKSPANGWRLILPSSASSGTDESSC